MATHLKLQKGFTLLELILYMSVFTILVGGVLYSSFYLQNVLQYNSSEYTSKESVYRQLTLLEEYAKHATGIEYSSTSLKIITKNSYMEQILKDEVLVVRFGHLQKVEIQFVQFPYMKFQEFSFKRGEKEDTYLTKSILYADIKWKNSKQKSGSLVDFLLIP